MNLVLGANTNFTNNITFAFNILGAVETDFNCAGFCRTSKYFTFSNVTRGPPTQSCTVAINEWMSSAVTLASVFFWIFFVLTLAAFVLTIVLTRKPISELESPLLGNKVA